MSESEISKLSKLAKSKIEEGQYTDAEYIFKKITRIDPENWYAWYGRGLCFKRMEMYERGIFCFSKATTLDPDSPKGWYNLGFCQSQINEIEEALFNLNKAIKLDRSFAIAMIIKAWIYLEHNNHETANKLIRHVKETNPDFIEKISDKDPSEEPGDLKIAIELLANLQ